MNTHPEQFEVSIVSKVNRIGLTVVMETQCQNEQQELDMMHRVGTVALMSFSAAFGASCPTCIANELISFLQQTKQDAENNVSVAMAMPQLALLTLALRAIVSGRPVQMKERFVVDLDKLLSHKSHFGLCKDEDNNRSAHSSLLH